MNFRKKLNVAVLVVSLLIVLSLGYSLVESRSLGNVVEKMVSDFLEETVQVTFEENEVNDFLTDILMGGMSEAAKGIGDKFQNAAGGIFILYRTGLLVPALLAMLSAGFVLGGKKRWRYLAGFGASLAGAVILGSTELLVIPYWIFSYIKKIGLLESLGDILKMSDIVKLLNPALGLGFWAGLALLVILSGACLSGYFVREEEDEETEDEDTEEIPAETDRNPANKIPEKKAFVQPVIQVIAGEYAGGTIPVQPGDTIKIGSDSGRCNLLLQGEGVAGLHCTIEFDRESDCFVVRDVTVHRSA